MNDITLILFKTALFLVSYAFISKKAFKFLKKKNPDATLWDVEIVAVAVIAAVIITSAGKHILKIFI